MRTELLRMSKKELLFHVLLWVLFLGSLLYAWQDNQLTSAIMFARLGSWVIAIVLPIYVNALILIPKYFNKTNWSKYLILSPLRKVKIHIFDFFNHSKTSVFANFRLGSCPHEPKLDFSEWTQY